MIKSTFFAALLALTAPAAQQTGSAPPAQQGVQSSQQQTESTRPAHPTRPGRPAPQSSGQTQGQAPTQQPPDSGAHIRPPQRGPRGSAVHLTNLAVSVVTENQMAKVTQTLTLKNTGDRIEEYDLIFPLGQHSIVRSMDLFDGRQILEGQVYPADQARAIYRDIVRKYRDPALLEHYGEGLFRARVFPIPPGEERTLTLRSTQVLDMQRGMNRLHLPLTGWRSSGTAFGLDIQGTLVGDRSVTTLYSPSHDVQRGAQRTRPESPSRVETRFTFATPKFTADEDFLLYFRHGDANSEGMLVDVTLLSERPETDAAGYFLAVLQGNLQKNIQPEPKNVIFVLDRSGSMEGKKLEQAKAALKFMVERLRPEDRFNLISYAANVDVFAGEMQPASPASVGEVLRYLDAVEAGGGTFIEGALEKSMELFTDSERLNQVVFLTDGLPTVGERDHRKITAKATQANAHDARIVAFGVGFDVNGAFLDRLAVQNGGLSEYVLPNENLEDKIPGFYATMSSPLIRKARLAFEGTKVFDVFPAEIHDLYGGRQTLVVGRYTDPGDCEVKLSGQRGSSRFELVSKSTLAADARGGAHGLVARLWASKKIGYLVDEIRLNGTNPELVDEIVRLGTRFGILTEYTAFLAAPETDLLDFDKNFELGRAEIRDRADEESGSHGVAQASNSKKLQRAAAAPRADSNRWLDDTGREVEIRTVQNVGNKTYFKRGESWLDATVAADTEAREVDLYSEELFTLLDQNAWLKRTVARTGDLIVDVNGEVLHIH